LRKENERGRLHRKAERGKKATEGKVKQEERQQENPRGWNRSQLKLVGENLKREYSKGHRHDDALGTNVRGSGLAIDGGRRFCYGGSTKEKGEGGKGAPSSRACG